MAQAHLQRHCERRVARSCTNTTARMLASGLEVVRRLPWIVGHPLTIQAGRGSRAVGHQATNQRAQPGLRQRLRRQDASTTGSTRRRSRNPRSAPMATSPRNGYDGPGFRTVDLSLVRQFALSGTNRIEARVEAFNAFNWFLPGNPTVSTSARHDLRADHVVLGCGESARDAVRAEVPVLIGGSCCECQARAVLLLAGAVSAGSILSAALDASDGCIARSPVFGLRLGPGPETADRRRGLDAAPRAAAAPAVLLRLSQRAGERGGPSTRRRSSTLDTLDTAERPSRREGVGARRRGSCGRG